MDEKNFTQKVGTIVPTVVLHNVFKCFYNRYDIIPRSRDNEEGRNDIQMQTSEDHKVREVAKRNRNAITDLLFICRLLNIR